MRNIELLSPAKNLECGLAAINHGADAVYIGAPMFSARAAAGNNIADIEQLISYAHRYRSKVLVALNTVLTDRQLTEAEKLIHQLYEIGTDALIVQDMGILQLDLPPIELHASTQTDNRTVEKVRFLQDVGFSRVVLARELTLRQIREIHDNTNVELECFIHGALCVSYSGQCYISQAMTGRSANRGECSQYCRLPYQLTDSDGQVLVKNKHLLSLKDLDLSDHLDELIDAGISSFKIEGRLKDADYVKNITAFYRKKLDAILECRKDVRKSSSGTTTFFFEPNPDKSFRRSATDYFLNGRQQNISQPETPKSIGEEIGTVTYISGQFIEIKTEKEIHNGDGLCFLTRDGILKGFRVNRVEGRKVFPAEMPEMDRNTFLYRNHDQEFDKILAGKTSERKIGVNILFSEKPDGFSIQITDEEGLSAISEFVSEKQAANNAERAIQTIESQLTKLGNTIYMARNVDISVNSPWFLPASVLNEWRRQAIELLDEKRREAYVTGKRRPANSEAAFPEKKLTYLGNVTNERAREFYLQHGVEEVMPGFEVQAEPGVPLMFCRHCIKYSLGWCPKEGYKATFKEPLYISYKDQQFQLEFDCRKCQMLVLKRKS
ncbi:MAG TPA: U32 family peptidase [Paludibacteraceae bacterium]|nr:U32 family peptidase [Paludibacteraceae bacterium]HPT43451.1 U32 family peptidase [Paludibacteraceae bacterium]